MAPIRALLGSRGFEQAQAGKNTDDVRVLNSTEQRGKLTYLSNPKRKT